MESSHGKSFLRIHPEGMREQDAGRLLEEVSYKCGIDGASETAAIRTLWGRAHDALAELQVEIDALRPRSS